MPNLNFQNLGPVGTKTSTANPAFSGSSAAPNVNKKGSATISQMKAVIRNHNQHHCIPLSGNKQQLQKRMANVELGSIFNDGGGGTKGQKVTTSKLKKLASAYGELDADANPELAFDMGGDTKVIQKKKKTTKKLQLVKGKKRLKQKKRA